MEETARTWRSDGNRPKYRITAGSSPASSTNDQLNTKMNYLVQKRSIRGTIASLEPTQTIRIPFADVAPTYVRNCCSILGVALGYKFSVHKDNEKEVYIVTRES